MSVIRLYAVVSLACLLLVIETSARPSEPRVNNQRLTQQVREKRDDEVSALLEKAHPKPAEERKCTSINDQVREKRDEVFALIENAHPKPAEETNAGKLSTCLN
ncbi:uncharacterized protein LOC124120528 [Haliotis rufescens]|uniref:uncharacterized protein LOC124120528 n=1 Tax=Haliotis rufescens TaxID=6454 RepID=UPI001EB08F61|nr:uncharacterized protein LOC124120528 [Haliotis rufescens]